MDKDKHVETKEAIEEKSGELPIGTKVAVTTKETNEKPSKESSKDASKNASKEKTDSHTVTFDSGPVAFEAKDALVKGISYDFNFGARVLLPKGKWKVRIMDSDAHYVSVNTNVDVDEYNTIISPKKKYYFRWRIEVYANEDMVGKRGKNIEKGTLVFSHNYNAEGKNILIEVCSKALGDSLAWIPYMLEFAKVHKVAKLYIRTTQVMCDLLKDSYPDVTFLPLKTPHPPEIYATYYVGNFFPSTDRGLQPYSWKIYGMLWLAAEALGLPRKELKLHIKATNKERKIKEPYVCIGTQATTQCKYWNNPLGWIETIKHLKGKGYRVFCIDKDMAYGPPGYINTIPWGAEDMTGNIPLSERVNILKHADFFVGLGSGLSWLAWACDVPVVMICGFAYPNFEFYTPYRIINTHVCHGCLSDYEEDFDYKRFDWCPRHQDDINRKFECTRMISSGQVALTIDKLMQDYQLNPKEGITRVDS